LRICCPHCQLESFDIVVSNPPYVGESEEDQVQLEVRKFEPRNAVFAGPTGLEVIERLIPQAHAALAPGGWLVFEISGTIADRRAEPALRMGSEVAIRNDLQGIARVAMARKSASKSCWWRAGIPRPARRATPVPPPQLLERHPHAKLRRERNSNRGAGTEEISQTALRYLELL
jgi:hypothetical protein